MPTSVISVVAGRRGWETPVFEVEVPEEAIGATTAIAPKSVPAAKVHPGESRFPDIFMALFLQTFLGYWARRKATRSPISASVKPMLKRVS